jgi:metallo-beta-lactamase family protein
MTTMQLQFFGAAETVTGSRTVVDADGLRVLVDCGLFQGWKTLRLRNRAPFPVPPSSIDAVVLTHAHLDHSGYLPALVRDGYAGAIHTTTGTAELLGLLLPDSAHLLEEEAEHARRKGYSRHEHPTPLYTAADAELALERVTAHPTDAPVPLGGGRDGLEATFLPAGHILGAAQVRLRHGGRTVHFSGDLGRADDPLMPPPRALEPADVVVVESTYGDRAHPHVDPEAELAGVLDRVLRRGGVVVVPAFVVGRAQGLLLHLARLKRRGAIPDVPIYLNSPMAVDATALYRAHRDELRIPDDDYDAMHEVARMVRTVDDSKLLNLRGGPMIIISASGMLTGGRVLHHLIAYGDDPANAILLTGYQAAGTRGAALAAGEDHLRIFGRDRPIRAEVVQLSSMSAHADADAIIDWLSTGLGPATRIVLNHGEPESLDRLRRRIADELGRQAIIAEQGMTLPV